MKIWKVILVTVVIFGTGVTTGGLLVRRCQPKPADEASRHAVTNRTFQGFKPERALRMDFITRTKEELGLTEEQIGRIETIVRESQARMRELWEQCSPQMHAEFKATQEKIREVLTPEQLEKFEALMKQRHPPRNEEWKRRDPEPPPPGPVNDEMNAE